MTISKPFDFWFAEETVLFCLPKRYLMPRFARDSFDVWQQAACGELAHWLKRRTKNGPLSAFARSHGGDEPG